MNLEEFVTEAEKVHRKNPEWRRGQAYFNTLYAVRPDIANMIVSTGVDPFYRDDWIPAFLDVVHFYMNEEN